VSITSVQLVHVKVKVKVKYAILSAVWAGCSSPFLGTTSGGNTQTRACSKRAAVNIVSFIRTAAPAMRSRATSAVATCRNDPNDNVTKVCCLVEQALTAATIADCIDRLRGDGVGGRDPEHSDRKRDDSLARRLQVIVAERLRPRQDIVSRFVFLCLRWMTPEQAF